MDFNVSVVTRRGGRPKNEDRADYAQLKDSALFVLADGMGGHPDGEVAAEIATRTLIDSFHKEIGSSTLISPSEFLIAAFKKAHHRIIRYGTEQGLLDVPRTTAVACFVQNHKMWWGNCGDSRLYLVRDGALKACTVDHSFVKEKELGYGRAGLARPTEPTSRNALYTCLGSITLPVIDVTGPISVRSHDRLLLCSDGLWSALSQEKIVAVLGSDEMISSVAFNLVESALLASGKKSDNVTLIAVECLHRDENTTSVDKFVGLQNIFEQNNILESEIDNAINEINALLQKTDKMKK